MKRVSLLVLALCSLYPAVSSSQSRSSATGLSIADIQAKLFYSNTGRFSANLIGNGKIVLSNVIVGEGGAEGPSVNTLLLVRLHGRPKAFVRGLLLRVVGRAGQDTLLDREIEVGEMNTSGNHYAAFWLYDTGCEPITVETTLAVGKGSQRATALIPFECAE